MIKKKARDSLEQGSLVYIPSKATVFKIDEKQVVTKQYSLDEPAIVPLIEIKSATHGRVYFKGEAWWAHLSDFYEVANNI